MGYGPRLGPLVVVAACARKPLRAPVRLADSKKVFSQAKGVGPLEPAVLGFLPATTLEDLLSKLSSRFPDAPWYRGAPLVLPAVPALPGLEAAYARVVDPDEFNRETLRRNKSEFLFEVVADLVNRVREAHPGPARFVVGKHGGRHYYLRGINQRISPTVLVREESPERSTYEIPGATITFHEDAEDVHELVALASMIGKYVREQGMRLFNDFWSARLEGLRRTAGYGADGSRFFRAIRPLLEAHGLVADQILRRR